MVQLGNRYVGQPLDALADLLLCEPALESKNAYLGIVQLLTDGLCARSRRFWQDAQGKRDVLDAVLTHGTTLVRGCYAGAPADAPGAARAVRDLLPDVARYVPDTGAVSLHLAGCEEQVWRLLHRVLDDKHAYDLVCGVASGGIEPMLLITSYLGARPFVLRYSGRCKDARVRAPVPYRHYLADAMGKRVLVVDDAIVTGRSLFSCMSALRDSGAALVHGGAVFDYGGTAATRLAARYGVREQDRWYVA